MVYVGAAGGMAVEDMRGDCRGAVLRGGQPHPGCSGGGASVAVVYTIVAAAAGWFVGEGELLEVPPFGRRRGDACGSLVGRHVEHAVPATDDLSVVYLLACVDSP